MLCRLTASTSTQGTQGRSPAQHSGELARATGSSLEHAWLAYVEQHGHRKPDRAQHTITSVRHLRRFLLRRLQPGSLHRWAAPRPRGAGGQGRRHQPQAGRARFPGRPFSQGPGRLVCGLWGQCRPLWSSEDCATRQTDLFEELSSASRRKLRTFAECAAAIDRLFQDAIASEGTSAFTEFIDFARRLSNLSVYNAMLVRLQRPGAAAVATEKRWVDMQRVVRPGAIPIVVLRPFGRCRSSMRCQTPMDHLFLGKCQPFCCSRNT